MLENLPTILSIIGGGLSLLSVALTFILKNVKNAKAKKLAESALKITAQVQDAVVLAEEITNFTGADKKKWVLTQVHQYALDNGITYDEEQVSNLIEQVVALTKQVNQREKDKVGTTSDTSTTSA